MAKDIIKEILSELPEGKISAAVFEGANIVLYTKSKSFVVEGNDLVKAVVNKIKKRIELRPDPELCIPEDKALKSIHEIMGKSSPITNVTFDKHRSIAIVETERPSEAIGNRGENLKAVKEITSWVPVVTRTPMLKSDITENIRNVLYESSDFRRKFLHKTGERIYNGWLRQKKHEWIRVSFLGGGRQVGRSCILLQTPESRILLDCGIDVASEDEAYPFLEAPELDIQGLDAIIVTHAHVDHTGLLPYLYKFGYRGPIYSTAPTRDIMALLQLDIIKIQQSEGKPALYNQEDIKEMVRHSIALDYEEVTDITPDVRITLHNAGHALGSAMVHLHIGNGLHNLLYTGDIKYARTRLLSPAATKFPRVETMIIESTYGGKENLQESIRTQDQVLEEIVKTTVNRKGKILMPTLGTGRGQEVIALVEKMIREGQLPEIPIYVDGMVWDITAIYTAYPEFLNNSVRQSMFSKDTNPFLNHNIKQVGSTRERRAIIDSDQSCIILATSGMLVGGPSLEYLKALGEDKKHSLVFSCYQGEGSTGRKIQRGEKELIFRDGQREQVLNLKMDVHKLEISGHADRRELMEFMKRLTPKPKRVIVNHGDSSRCIDLASTIHKRFRIETTAPRNLDVLRIR